MVEYRGKQIHVTGWAQRFLFEQDQLSTFVENLSGGEQARLLIANLMLTPADVLLLDEPTNDLDIPSLEVLEQSLLEFPGAIAMVTHDRFMLDRIATDFLGLDGQGGIKEFQTVDQWQQYCANLTENRPPHSAPPSSSIKTAPVRNRDHKLSWKEQKELEGIEAAILEAESEVESLEPQTQNPEMVQDLSLIHI